MKIKIKLPKLKRFPLKCIDCQAYYLTKNSCRCFPRWVKCGEGHFSSDSTKQPSDPVKCAVYSRGCMQPRVMDAFFFYKNLISTRIRHEAIKYNIRSTRTFAVMPQNDSAPSTNQKYKQSYADITSLQCIAHRSSTWKYNLWRSRKTRLGEVVMSIISLLLVRGRATPACVVSVLQLVRNIANLQQITLSSGGLEN